MGSLLLGIRRVSFAELYIEEQCALTRWIAPGGTLSSWRESYEKAAKLVNEMTLIEKVNVTTGVGWQMGLCVGNTGVLYVTLLRTVTQAHLQ